MGGGGTFTGTIDVEKIVEAANTRIKDAFEAGEYVLFGVNFSDVAELEKRILATGKMGTLNYKIAHEHSDGIDQLVDSASLIIIYSGSNENDDWLTTFVRKALAAKKSTIGTKALESSAGTPKFVSQYRMRLVSWSELTDLLSE